MKQWLKICILALIFCSSTSCAESLSNATKTFENEAYTPTHASGFVIMTDNEGNTLLRVTRPWQGDNTQEQNLAIFTDEEAATG